MTERTQGRQRTVRLWMAAACIVAAAVVCWLLMDRGHSRSVDGTTSNAAPPVSDYPTLLGSRAPADESAEVPEMGAEAPPGAENAVETEVEQRVLRGRVVVAGTG